MATSGGIASIHVQKHHRKINNTYVLVWLVTLVYAFDTMVSLALPSNALVSVSYLYKQFWEQFQNPITLLGIYLASLCEILALSKILPALKYKIKSLKKQVM